MKLMAGAASRSILPTVNGGRYYLNDALAGLCPALSTPMIPAFRSRWRNTSAPDLTGGSAQLRASYSSTSAGMLL
jgi:hypothetical protein